MNILFDQLTQDVLLRMMVAVCRRIRETHEAFEELRSFSVRGQGGWQISVAYRQRGVYEFRTFDPGPARAQGIDDMIVCGRFVFVESGDITGEMVGPAHMRFNVTTDYSYMIPIMLYILEKFEALMEIPARYSDGDPLRDVPNAEDLDEAPPPEFESGSSD